MLLLVTTPTVFTSCCGDEEGFDTLGSIFRQNAANTQRFVIWMGQDSHQFQCASHCFSFPDALLNRNYDAGKGKFLVSLRHENRSGMLISLDMRTFARCVPILTRLWPNLVEAIEWILHRHTLHLTEARLCAQCS